MIHRFRPKKTSVTRRTESRFRKVASFFVRRPNFCPQSLEMGDLITEYTELLQQQELRIQSVSAEIEALKAENPGSARLEEVMEECSRLKYRVNIVTRALQKEQTRCGQPGVN